VAGFATRIRSVGTHLLHSFFKLTSVGIGVARRAGAVFEAILRNILCLGRGFFFVTIAAGDGNMSSGQQEAGLLVLRQSESRGPESIERVALLTAVEVGRRGELPLMFVFVAIHAAIKFDFVDCFFTSWDVALRALQRRMFALQRVGGRGMLVQAELGRLKSIHGVAGRAFSSIGPRGELALVLIFMAVHAALKGNRLFKVAAAVTLHAFHSLMFPKQRVFGLGVIKVLIERCRRNPLPTAGVVAILATLLGKTSMVWIRVAIGTLAEGYSDIARLIVGSGRVALLAGYLRVQAGQWVSRLGVIELPAANPERCNLPTAVVVTLQTVLA
jgi:hypothetical protein